MTDKEKIEYYENLLNQKFKIENNQLVKLKAPTMTECGTWQRGGNYGQPHLCEDLVTSDCKCSEHQNAKTLKEHLKL